jgi:hypothetical protein
MNSIPLSPSQFSSTNVLTISQQNQQKLNKQFSDKQFINELNHLIHDFPDDYINILANNSNLDLDLYRYNNYSNYDPIEQYDQNGKLLDKNNLDCLENGLFLNNIDVSNEMFTNKYKLVEINSNDTNYYNIDYIPKIFNTKTIHYRYLSCHDISIIYKCWNKIQLNTNYYKIVNQYLYNKFKYSSNVLNEVIHCYKLLDNIKSHMTLNSCLYFNTNKSNMKVVLIN